MQNNKKKASTITEQELRKLYFDKEMSLDEIGRYFGYSDRQPIQKLFKKFEIKTRDKSTLQKMQGPKPPSKEEFISVASIMSDLKAATYFKVHRSNIAEWRKLYDVPNTWFKNTSKVSEIKSDNCSNLTPIEIAEKLNVDVGFVKQHRVFSEELYSIEKIKNLISNIDMDGQGSSKEIKLSDLNLWKSIEHHTKNWIFSTDKATEKVYRLVNDMQYPECCTLCGKPSNFLTYHEGYHKGGCKGCLKKGVSGISLRLFDELLTRLPEKEHKWVRYHNLVGEQIIYVTDKDRTVFPNTTFKYRYYLDFIYRTNVIEFDGIYWHQNTKEKDDAKDLFLKHRGLSVLRVTDKEYIDNPQGTIEKCMNHLNA